MKTALITGAAGYLGSHLAKSLKKSGWKVVGLGHKRHTMNQYLDVMHYADVRNIDDVDDLFSRIKFDVVFHLAARIEAGVSFKEPTEFYSVNTGGTCNVINAMVKHGVKNIVFSSTAAVYQASNTPLKEDDPKFDNSPYGNSKLCAEAAIKASGLNYVISRYFNLTGADPEGEFGEEHEPETHLIPRLIQNLNNFQINGDDYNTPDGTCVRDYVHVTDIASAHNEASEYLLNGGKSITLNLGTGQGFSILQIISKLEEVTGQKVNYTVNPRRPGDADSLVADINLATEVLNYHPKHDIMSILKTAYDWHNKDDE
jgi:UDP-glucose-4-epimerase GalE